MMCVFFCDCASRETVETSNNSMSSRCSSLALRRKELVDDNVVHLVVLNHVSFWRPRIYTTWQPWPVAHLCWIQKTMTMTMTHSDEVTNWSQNLAPRTLLLGSWPYAKKKIVKPVRFARQAKKTLGALYKTIRWVMCREAKKKKEA